MTCSVDCSTVVVSDTHFSVRGDPAQVLRFCGFLDWISRQATSFCGRVVIAGDFFNLDLFDSKDESAGELGATGRLVRILEKFPELETALASVLAAGIDVTVLPGNHDAELLAPHTADALRRAILRRVGAGGATTAGSLDLSPRSFFRIAGTHVEHGNRFDPDNVFDDESLDRIRGGREPLLPLGSCMDRYFTTRFPQLDCRGFSAGTPWSLLKTVLGRHGLSGGLRIVLGYYATAFGLLLESCRRRRSGSLEDGPVRPTLSSPVRTFHRLYLDRSAAFAAAIAWLLAAPALLPAAAALWLAGAGCLGIALLASLAGGNRYGAAAALSCADGALEVMKDPTVDIVIMGHSHGAVESVVDEAGRQYVNSGAFLAHSQAGCPYVLVTPTGSGQRAELRSHGAPSASAGSPGPGSPRILLIGYNGANNTGSEARLLAVVEDVRAVLGPSASITIPTLDAARESRYLREGAGLHLLPYSMRDLLKIGRLVRLHDIVLLVEGSCYMETWTSSMLLAFLRVSTCASAMHKPCLAYAVDAGQLSRTNQRRVRRQASKTSLIVLRSEAAADRLRSWGVTAPIEVTADAAFSLPLAPSDDDLPARLWPEATSGVVGMALVDFYRWPVVFRLWGRSRDCYRWPFYFSSSKARERASEELVRRFAAEADRIVERHGHFIALLCMEELDTPLAHRVHRQMAYSNRARVFSSCEYNVTQMAALLRSLHALISSRYHACVLAMPAGVPMVAVGHDLRIKELFQEIGLPDDLFIPHDCPRLSTRLSRCVDTLLTDPEPTTGAVARGHTLLRERAMRNRQILEVFVHRSGWR